ncbi:MAG TPA: hypothetical protein VGY99_04990 [Candidatus Binataceae bacterium]|nr:hypothetical protein [Candidatus Binataceae bacterium]
MRSRIAIVMMMALAIAASAVAQTAVKIHDVLRSPGQYSEHDVAVFGHVRALAAGPQYTTFKICGAHCLNVLAWGHPRISEGEALSVRGRFHVLKEIDHHKVHNLVEVEHGSL